MLTAFFLELNPLHMLNIELTFVAFSQTKSYSLLEPVQRINLTISIKEIVSRSITDKTQIKI